MKGGPQLRRQDIDPQSRGMNELKSRDSYEYLTIRGCEESSILIGLRASSGNDLELLDWERRLECQYTRRCRGTCKANAYIRCMIAKVTLDHGIGYMGAAHVVMPMHLHTNMANGRLPAKLKGFGHWLVAKLRAFNVRVLMGDFNM